MIGRLANERIAFLLQQAGFHLVKNVVSNSEMQSLLAEVADCRRMPAIGLVKQDRQAGDVVCSAAMRLARLGYSKQEIKDAMRAYCEAAIIRACSWADAEDALDSGELASKVDEGIAGMVWKSLPMITDKDDAKAINETIDEKVRLGWQVPDVVTFCLLLEEAGCKLPEAEALAGMAALQDKYSMNAAVKRTKERLK
jgi:hypothetical protein